MKVSLALLMILGFSGSTVFCQDKPEDGPRVFVLIASRGRREALQAGQMATGERILKAELAPKQPRSSRLSVSVARP